MKRLHWVLIALVSVTLYPAFFAASLHALTVEQIIKLKEAGVEDRTIQMLIEQEEANREGREGLGVKETTRADGGKERTYYSVTTSDEHQKIEIEERVKLEKALEILRNIIIDERRR
jgi:hypothetical protein